VRDAGVAFCDGNSVTPAELLAPAAACGRTPATTAGAYDGIVGLTVSGLVVNVPEVSIQDAFYDVDPADTSVALNACPDCLRYNRFSEGDCVCGNECAASSHLVADLLVGDYPPFRPDHAYAVIVDLGQAVAADRLHFGMADCGCGDNSGAYALSITPLAPGTCER
jgi:hypothetical protein